MRSGLAQRMFIGPLLLWIAVTSALMLGRLSSVDGAGAWPMARTASTEH